MYRECIVLKFILFILIKSSRPKFSVNIPDSDLQSSRLKEIVIVNCNKIIKNERFEIQSFERLTVPLNCSYVFKGPSCPTFFNVKFIEFNLRSFSGCNVNSLEVVNNEILCGRIYGSKTYFSSEGLLRIKIVLKSNLSDDSYKILVTRLPCFIKPQRTRDDVIVSQNAIKPYRSERYPFCCGQRYDARQFYLTSPNFPYSKNVKDQCVYHIYKFSPRICHLRVNFLFFSVDEETSDNTCHKGFLEIDEKYFCGCRTGLQLLLPFNSSMKTIRFKNADCRSEFSGFVVEVMQEECSERFSGEYTQDVLQFYNEQAVYSKTNLKRARLTKENIYSDRTDPDIVKHVYVFEDTEENDKSDKEKIFSDTTEISYYDFNKCKSSDVMQLKILSNNVLWQEISKCSTVSGKSYSAQCVQANLVKGYIQSPDYPHFYPKGLHTCYRFEPLSGYCAVRLYILDFDVENSYHCEKDYLLLGQQYKYCGRTLHKASLTFDLRNRYEEIAFITNGFSCRRGFKSLYERIPCNNDGIPVDPIYPTSPKPITSTPTVMNNKPCNRNIQDNLFLLEVYSYHQSRCIFNIIRKNKNVCRLLLRFDRFTLSCEYEYLLIGNQRYCGNREGENVILEFDDNKLPITYVRSSTFPVKSSLLFRISGKQLMTECDLIDVPTVDPERLISSKGTTTRDHNKDICGLLLNSQDDHLASKICNLVKARSNSTKCIPITEKMSFMMYPSFKGSMDMVIRRDGLIGEKITVQEVACKDIYTVIFN
ncbi:hypothetical protein RI129_004999 [Pyrocoelia pectoralis]|uniref:CUB domain-containing protein n=1 Tax=Pyrocoelia pectoralis TaxID=417401 RepID=A0AAN7ZH68_9COLE